MTDAFDAWNLRLLQEFFSSASRGEEVFLATDADTLDEIGPDLGGDAGFMVAVRAGASWARGSDNFVQKVLRLVDQRCQGRLRPPSYVDPARLDRSYVPGSREQCAPTFLPYLAALVRSADADEYYKEVQGALALPVTWGPVQMAEVERAWDDLAAWTRAMDGEFGRFTKRVIGGYVRIGVPKSQTLVNRRDAGRFGRLFHEMGLVREQARIPMDGIIQSIHHGHGFSAALRDAAGKPSYFPLLKERLSTAFEEWDGTGAADEEEAAAGIPVRNLKLCLGLGPGNHPPWQVRWRVPGALPPGHSWLELDGDKWAIAARDSAGATFGPENPRSANAALERRPPPRFSLRVEQEDGAPTQCTVWDLPSKRIRVLVGRQALGGAWEINESDLPGGGNAYILATPEAASDLRAYFEREQPAHQWVTTDGLPERWLLAYLPSQTLSNDQRSLPDGQATHPRPRVIRYEGGVSIQRAGRRLYLPYDLPEIIVDGPEGTALVVEGPSGSDLLVEKQQVAPVEGNALGIAPVPRFSIQERDPGRGGHYVLKAVSNGEEIGSAVMRIQPLSTSSIGHAADFSIDELGRAQRAGRPGLRGLIQSADNSLGGIEPLAVANVELGREVVGVGRWRECVPALFLDALGGTGVMAFGRARDLIHRMQARQGKSPDAWSVLGDLRSRGHLEIELSVRGHWSRIHAVPASLYELPILCCGAKVLGVLGTIGVTQWELLETPMEGCQVLRQETKGLPALRFLMREGIDRRAIGERLGLQTYGFPGLALASWSASWKQVLDSLASRCVETVPRRQESAEKYSARRGDFFPLPADAGIGRPGINDPAFVLYQIQDPDIRDQVSRVRVAAMRGGFSFVHDRQWAAWLALESFGDFLRNRWQLEDASPWPLPHDLRRRDLWLPARLSLPAVLERALVLCGGAPPEEYNLEMEEDGPVIRLVTKGTRVAVISTSRVYDGMMEYGKWLRYRWVPSEVLYAMQQDSSQLESLGDRQ